MLCCGCTTDQIGEALNITKNTVYNHLDSLYSAFHVVNREEMIAIAWDMGLVTTKDIRFYNRRRELKRLPEWAAVKRKCDKFYFD